MSTELFIKIVSGLISVIFAIVSAYLVPYLQSRYTVEQLNNVKKYIEIMVKCAEQIFTPEQWQEKKKYVMQMTLDYINKNLRTNLDKKQIDAIIEGIVNEVKNAG